MGGWREKFSGQPLGLRFAFYDSLECLCSRAFLAKGEKRLKLTRAFKNPFSYFVGVNAVWWHHANLIKCILDAAHLLEKEHSLGVINCYYAISLSVSLPLFLSLHVARSWVRLVQFITCNMCMKLWSESRWKSRKWDAWWQTLTKHRKYFKVLVFKIVVIRFSGNTYV